MTQEGDWIFKQKKWYLQRSWHRSEASMTGVEWGRRWQNMSLENKWRSGQGVEASAVIVVYSEVEAIGFGTGVTIWLILKRISGYWIENKVHVVGQEAGSPAWFSLHPGSWNMEPGFPILNLLQRPLWWSPLVEGPVVSSGDWPSGPGLNVRIHTVKQ